MQGIAANTFGAGSAEHKTFLPQALSELDAGGLLLLAPVIVLQGNTFLTQMGAKGLTAAMLATITTQANTLKPLCTAFNTAEGVQLLTTKNRHIAANALYDEMSEMCETAVVYYQDRNPLKASLYIIYDGSNTSQQRNGSVLGETTIGREFKSLPLNAFILNLLSAAIVLNSLPIVVSPSTLPLRCWLVLLPS